VAGYGINNREMGFRFPEDVRDCSLIQNAQIRTGDRPASYSIASTTAKQPVREGDHSPLISVEVKDEKTYTSTPAIKFINHLRFPAMLRGVDCLLVIDVSGQPGGPISKGQSAQEDCLTLGDEADCSSRSVGN
jgi:hypothetical protein